MTLPEIEAVRAFNIAYWDAGLRNALFHRVMHFGAAAYMKQRPPAADEPRIETPQWALARSARSHARWSDGSRTAASASSETSRR